MVDLASFRFDDSNGSYEKGYKKQAVLMDDIAQTRAGNALTRGDSRGAANALYSAGNLRDGAVIEDRAYDQAADAAKTTEARRKTALEYTATMAGRLNDVYDASPDKLPEAFDLLSGDLVRLGETPEAISQLRNRLTTDPKTTLLTLGAKASEALGYDVRNAGDEVLVIDKKTGGLVNRYRGAQTVNVPEGGALYEIPGQGSPERLNAPQAAPQAQPGAVGAAPANDPRPRSVRNNNPGNIEDGAFARSLPGYKGSDGRFAIFETPEAGIGGQVALLGSYGKRGINTVSAIINRWAPSSDGNNTPAYTKYVADRIGVGPDQTLDMTDAGTLSDIAAAIQQFEGGPQSASSGRPAPQPQGQGGDPRLVVSRPKPANTVQTLTPAEVEAQGFLPGTVVQRKPDGSLNTVQSPNNASGPRKAEADLRKELTQRPEVKDYRAVKTSFQQIQSLASKPASAAGDLSLIFSYMKMLDPGSVVREGEFATAQNAAGIPDQVQNAYNKALNGQRLNTKQRADFLANAKNIYGTQSARYNQIADEYRSYATDYGIDPDRVATRETPEEAKPPKGARLGRSGKYYIADPNKPGSFPEISQGPDGVWRLKSANGKTLKWTD